ncbi:uL15 family ribosomal protein [Candidatus Nomurabacteria bacterium]|nr:MAG: uL15 family ribosomal protein [Candidatus Nomurabacteria bacterium]
MQFHTLQRKNKNPKKITVGRGGRRGKTSGRGTKGQKARAGHKIRPMIRDIIKKLPKRRGRGKNSFKSFAYKPKTVNLAVLEKHFTTGEVVTPSSLLAKGLITRTKGVTPRVKILSDGELTKKLTIKDCLVSVVTREKLTTGGSTIL